MRDPPAPRACHALPGGGAAIHLCHQPVPLRHPPRLSPLLLPPPSLVPLQGVSREEFIATVARDIQVKIPEQFDLPLLKKEIGVPSPTQVVLLQELERWNKVLQVRAEHSMGWGGEERRGHTRVPMLRLGHGPTRSYLSAPIPIR